MKKLLILILLLIAGNAWGTTYYISSVTGDDTRTSTTAQSPDTPWAHHPDDASATSNCTAYAPQNGDIFYFKRGEIWYNVSISTTGGSQTITSTAGYGSGALPVLNGGWSPSTLSWALDSGTTYKSSVVTAAPVLVIYRNGGTDTKLTLGSAHDALTSNQYWWGDDGGTNYLFVNIGGDPGSTILAGRRSTIIAYATDSVTLSNLTIEVNNSSTTGLIYTNNRAGLTISGNTFQHSAGRGLYALGSGTGGNLTISGNTWAQGFAAHNALFMSGLTGTNVVSGNTILSCAQYAIYSSTTATQALAISGNTIHDIPSGTSAIHIAAGGASGGIYNNTIYSIAGTSYGIQIANAASNTGIPIYGNTIYGVYYGISFAGTSATGNSVYNNALGASGAGNQVTTAISAIAAQLIYGNTITNHNVGIYFTNGSSGAKIYENIVHDSYTSGVSQIGIHVVNGSAVDVYSNTLYNNWNGLSYGSGGLGNGIVLAGTATGVLVYKNLVYNNYGGITLTDSGAGANQIYYNLVYDSYVNCIDIQSSGTTAHTLVYNNSVRHTPRMANNSDGIGHGIDVQVSGKLVKIYNNIVYVNADPNITAANYGYDDCNGIAIAYQAGMDVYLDNNAVYPMKSGANLYLLEGVEHKSLSAAITAMQSIAYIRNNAGETNKGCEHCVAGDPLIVSTSTPNCHLQSGSPAINAGVDVGLTTDIEGNPIKGLPDIGAYEYQGGSGTQTIYRMNGGMFFHKVGGI